MNQREVDDQKVVHDEPLVHNTFVIASDVYFCTIPAFDPKRCFFFPDTPVLTVEMHSIKAIFAMGASF